MRALKLLAVSAAMAMLSACGSLMPATAESPTSATYTAQFDAVWNTFDQQYPYFEQKKVDWNAVRARYRPAAAAATNQAELAAVVRDMLANLHDQHVALRDPNGRTIPTWTAANFVNWDAGVWEQYVRRAGWVQGQRNWGYAVFHGDAAEVPYIAIGSWRPEQVKLADLDAALERFRSAPALIIDVRMNAGGDTRLAYEFAARFAPTARPAEYLQYRSGPGHADFAAPQARTLAPRGAWQFTRPVMLLMGRGSASANESFIAAMRELPNVTTVGDTSAGSSGNPAVYQLGGGWMYTVSRAIDYTAEQQVIEDAGIAPMIPVSTSPADFEQGRDPVLEFALSRFNVRVNLADSVPLGP
jgi:hypothetical protein